MDEMHGDMYGMEDGEEDQMMYGEEMMGDSQDEEGMHHEMMDDSYGEEQHSPGEY